MKGRRTFLTVSVLVLLVVALIAIGSSLVAGSALSRTDPVSQQPGQSPGLEPFFRLPEGSEAALKTIVVNDPQIKPLLAATPYDWNLNVGARLIGGMTPDIINGWLKSGEIDQSIVKEYVGILHVGYNERYLFSIDVEHKAVVGLAKQVSGRSIPELERQDKDAALAAVASDTLLQTLLSGKDYQVAPEGRIGVWHSKDLRKLGVATEILFDRTYRLEQNLPSIDYDMSNYAFPYYAETLAYYSGEAAGIAVFVDLEGKVVAVQPIPEFVSK